MIIKTKDEKRLIKKLKKHRKVIIYGAGMVGKLTLEWLKLMKFDHKLLCFCVTSIADNPKGINSFAVKEIGAMTQIEADTLIIVSALGEARRQMHDYVSQLGFMNVFVIEDTIYSDFVRHAKTQEERSLYVCLTYYHVLIALVKTIISKQSSDMILGVELNENHDLAYGLLKSGYIKNVVYLNHDNTIDYQTKSVFIRKFFDYRKIIKTFEKEVTVDFKRYKKVYVFSDNNIIGKYLCAKKCAHYYLEDALDVFKGLPLIFPEITSCWQGNMFKIYTTFNLKFFSHGQSKFCKSIEVNNKEGLPIPLKNRSKIVELPRKELFSLLDEEEKEKIFDVFMDDKEVNFHKGGKSILILTSPLNEVLVDTVQTSGEIHKNIIEDVKDDFENIYLKPHPRDRHSYENVQGIKIIDKNIPIEILNFKKTMLFDKAITICSAAIGGIEFVREKEILGIEYVEQFMNSVKQ